MVAVQNPEIRKAVDTLYELSADGKVRAEYEMRQKARRDRLWQIDNARQDGREDGIKAMYELIKDGKTPEEAMKILELEGTH